MTYSEVCEQMREIVEASKADPEIGHAQADDLLKAWLENIGQDELAVAYDLVEKWYA